MAKPANIDGFFKPKGVPGQTVRSFLNDPGSLLMNPQTANPMNLWLGNLGNPETQIAGSPAPNPAPVIIAQWNRAREILTPIAQLWRRPKSTTTSS